ncbi:MULTISPECIES: hypothetical protein [Kitasatospora]|uniref:Uncharacterized protein n=1 Tax=Kitasatospora setae (strain ATCC 33774 / DSM 43861 / JCM 3304 / KCC A-0304 / NBRC 14216 / KM-6054) TaxID=452652 RepID=E4N642_KITSK|nr:MULTISPECIES: hypothetical protein [Kitasatospora]BAJ26673.1 hypothetical protein KSE_08340 [Kitasatospora setae KM-6054]
MPFAETPLRDEYAAAVDRLARRVLDALQDGTAPPPAEAGTTAAGPAGAAGADRPLLAAARVLGADLFAPRLLAGAAPDAPTAALLAEARRVLPAPAAPTPGAALVIAWQDWATGRLLGDAPPPPAPPDPAELGWQTWSVRMSQLAALALPRLDGPLHDTARAHPLPLARGTARALLRRDPATAARLTRWLAWTESQGLPPHLETAPVLDRIRLAGDGSARTALTLAITHRLAERVPGTGGGTGTSGGRRAA